MKMMKVKTSELQGTALDWAVAWCERKSITLFCGVMVKENDGMLTPTRANPLKVWTPSATWAQGGPIIERERIELRGDGDGGWIACDNVGPDQYGPTPLVAAMRCYVASKLGDTVDVPDDLVWDELIYEKGEHE